MTAQGEKNIIAVVIVLVAGWIFYTYLQNQNFLYFTSNGMMYMVLASFALVLLLVLFFMVSNRADKKPVKSTSKKSSKKSSR